MNTEETYSQSVHAALAAGNADLNADPSDTVRPTASSGDPASNRSLDAGLSDTGEELGRGGMGVVRAAIQRSLGRQVAVKAPTADSPPPHVIRGLLQEAFVTGVLDHPNVLPIHDVVLDARGRPQIVMKRVEGQPWSAIARRPPEILATYGATDALEWNLGVFLQVANAVAYAHDRGILHRDIKLDNVMIGRFGEVLLLDWGVAIALDDRYGDRLPVVTTERRVAGTPRYMAPEMATGRGDAQGPWTDVYLLGGVLHHVLTGRPPHRGAELRDVLLGIPDFVCELPGVPRALAAIVAKALASAPAARHPDVATLQREVRAFLAHRGAVRLAREAGLRLGDLQARLTVEDTPPGEIYGAFGPVRFGFEQALAEWPDFADAAVGLVDAKVSLARWELGRGEPGAAAALIDDLPDAPADLRAAIAAAVSARRAREAALLAIQRDVDPRIGRRTRAFVLAVMGGVWVLMPVLLGYFAVQATWARMHASTAALFVALAGAVLWARDSLSKTQVNRLSAAVLLLIAPLQLAGDVAAQLAGVTPDGAMALRAVGWAALTATYAVAVERTFAAAAVAFVGAAWLASARPETLPWAVSASNAVLVAAVYVAWGREQLREDRIAKATGG